MRAIDRVIRTMDWVARILAYGAFIALVSTSCSTINVIQGRLSSLAYIDSAVTPYSARFVVEAKKRNIEVNLSKITMVFGSVKLNKESATIGTCEDMYGYPVIFLDKAYWEIADEFEKESLTFHELGHCVLSREHCDIKVDGHGISIMESEMGSSLYYQANRETLINELFSPSEGCTLHERSK